MTFKYEDIATVEDETFKFKDIVGEPKPLLGPVTIEDEEKQIGEIVDWSDILGMKTFDVEQLYDPLTEMLKAVPEPKDIGKIPQEIEQPQLEVAEPKGTLLERFFGFKYPAKPPGWEDASLIEKFTFITLPISDALGRIGGKIASDWRLMKKEDVQKILAHELDEDLKWYQKSPELVGWTAEKIAEAIMLKGIFKASGLHKVLTTAGQKAAAPFLTKAIVARGGIQTLKTMSAAGIKDVGRQAITSFLTAAPENITFISSWSALDAIMDGKSGEQVLEEAMRGAGWGLAITAGLSVIAPIAKIPEIKLAFSKAMTNIAKKYPRALDAIGKDIPKEVEKEWLRVIGKTMGKDVRLIDLTVRERAMFRNAIRAAEREILKAAEKEAAIKAYWSTKAAKAAEKAKPPVKAIEKPPSKPVAPITKPEAVKPPVEAKLVVIPSKMTHTATEAISAMIDKAYATKDIGRLKQIREALADRIDEALGDGRIDDARSARELLTGMTHVLDTLEDLDRKKIKALAKPPAIAERVEVFAIEAEQTLEATGEMALDDSQVNKIVGDIMPTGLAITPRFGVIREAYHRAHDWLFTFGQARREDPELYDQLMSAFGKRGSAVEKAIGEMEEIVPKSITLPDDVMMSKVYEDKRLSPTDELKDTYDGFANLLDELSKKQQEEGLFAQPFNERMIEENNVKIEKLAGELMHPKKSKRIKALREENAILEQMRYLSHGIVAKRSIESKINTLTGEKKKAFLSRLSAFYRKRKGKLFLADYLKAGLITEEDMRITRLATEELADYYVRSAYKGLYDYAKEKGYIKPISEELREEGWLNQRELGITAPELKEQLVHPLLGSALAEMKAMRIGRGSLVSQIFGMTKIGQFIKPTIVWVYDAVQKYMRGMYSFNPITESKALVQSTKSVLKKDELYHKLNESNLFQFPYEVSRAAREDEIEKFIHQHSAEIDAVTKMLEKATDTRWLDPDMTVGKMVKNIIMAAHRGVARITWTGDKIQRTQSYLILRKFGYSHDEAVKVAASSHGGYSLLSEKYKAKASKVLFVYSFRFLMPIEMSKTIAEPLIAAKDTMGGAKIPKHHWERMVKAAVASTLIPIGIDQYMKWRGFEKEGVYVPGLNLAWKWRKEVKVDGETREIVVGMNYILNMPVKYWQRLTQFNPITPDTRALQMLKNAAKWELHPLYRIFFWDINENRRSFGTGVNVYDAEANPAVQFGQIAKYIFGQSFRFWGGMMDAIGEGDMTEKERIEQDKIFDSALSDLDKVLFTALGYKYIRQPLKERQAIMHKYLEKELVSRIFQAARKYEGEEFEQRKIGLERWARKCEDWIQNKMR